jgi:hypothetical protein
MITADDLRHEREVKDRVKYAIFKRILSQCLEAVKLKNESCTEMWLFYEVPKLIPGEPLYKHYECIQFLTPMIQECGFWVKQCKPGNILFISWHPDHNKSSSKVVPFSHNAFLSNALQMIPSRRLNGKSPIVEDLK